MIVVTNSGRYGLKNSLFYDDDGKLKEYHIEINRSFSTIVNDSIIRLIREEKELSQWTM